MKFTIICKRCYNSKKDRTIVDNCTVFLTEGGQLLIHCLECREVEPLLEEEEEVTIAYSRRDELIKEKKKLEQELKKKQN